MKENMVVLKRGMFCIALFIFVFTAGVCFADDGIPNIVGTWIVRADGAVLVKGANQGQKTHHSGEFSALTAEVIVDKQQGRMLRGTFKSARATENFVAAIGLDNKSFFYADEDGVLEGKIVNKDKIDVIYRHVTTLDTVIGVGTWTRKK